MNNESIRILTKGLTGKKKLVVLGITILLSIGAFGAINEYSGNKQGGVLSGLAEKIGLKQKENINNRAIPIQTGTPQLSKEYVYAGSRMLATEDYGVAQPNPTPTP